MICYYLPSCYEQIKSDQFAYELSITDDLINANLDCIVGDFNVDFRRNNLNTKFAFASAVQFL